MWTSQKLVKQKTRRPPARMGALASLPVFFQLKERMVLVAGGTEAAAWKAELLAASGANVHVYADELDPVMEQLLASSSVSGSLVHHARVWGDYSFKDMALAIGDAETDVEAKAFYHAARAAGVPVNVIDNPPYCELQFGSIVNRSPVVIGISTNGVAPILGQAIRRRIETLLPLNLAGWAALAGRVRENVMDRLAPGPQRRRFWERFTEFAFSACSAPKAENEISALIDSTETLQTADRGQVTLVGAGPGSAEHLTLKAVRALQSADVILFDDLVSDEVLELARREAKRMLVGKRRERESCCQEDINDMMVSLAKKGKNVVRLKSGDPMIFGRTGEEIERIKSEGLLVSIVPGISAASAMASELGTSLAQRDNTQSIRFITGKSKAGEIPQTPALSGFSGDAIPTVVK